MSIAGQDGACRVCEVGRTLADAPSVQTGPRQIRSARSWNARDRGAKMISCPGRMRPVDAALLAAPPSGTARSVRVGEALA